MYIHKRRFLNALALTMTLPYSENLSTSAMNRVFDNTVATYKFYWLLALLDIFVKEGKSQVPALDVASRMVAYAWYPIEFFKLSFGYGDSMGNIIPQVAQLTGITVDDKLEDKSKVIQDAVRDNRVVRGKVKKLLDNVPYWFLSPWFPQKSRHDIIILSQSYENSCLYALSGTGENLMVTANPLWQNYLQKNYQILRDFAFWNLSLFLQSKNPNIPNIANKLIRPEVRESLASKTKFWNIVIDRGGPIKCIYTNELLGKNDFQLDHFIPWSFVSHNQNWNLIPAKGSINSSKSNRIPDLHLYLPKLAKIQHKALQLYIPTSSKNDSILAEYYALGRSPEDLMQMPEEDFLAVFEKTFSPLSQMAINMGFSTF